MALFTEAAVRERAKAEQRNASPGRKMEEMIKGASAAYDPTKTYDIFLSHSIRDAELILGIKLILEDLGYSVYVDWVDDPQLDRSKVTSMTADKLRERMNSSTSLFYVTTENSSTSRWMPWECGYFDGRRGKVAIVPIVRTSNDNHYVGQEYLGLYPYVIKQQSNKGRERLWIHKNKSYYIDYDSWIDPRDSELDSKWRKL